MPLACQPSPPLDYKLDLTGVRIQRMHENKVNDCSDYEPAHGQLELSQYQHFSSVLVLGCVHVCTCKS